MMNNLIAIAQSLSKFQLIEGTLKAFLAKHQSDQAKVYKNSKKFYLVTEFNEMSYGILLKQYKKICSDQSLWNRLFTLKENRDYLAHRALIANLNNIDDDFKKLLGVKPILIDYVMLNKELDECVDLMIEEYVLLLENT